jgi:hypothetical protein
MNQTNGLLRAMTSNDVSVAMGRRIELGEDHPAVGGGWLDVTAAPLPRTPFNDDVAALDRTRVTTLVVVPVGQESTIVQENQRFMAHCLTVWTRSYRWITQRRWLRRLPTWKSSARRSSGPSPAGRVRSFQRRTNLATPLSQSRQSASPGRPINVLQGELRCRMM